MARGRLRIYLGAAPGVGKTYAMLSEAHRRRRAGHRRAWSASSSTTAGRAPRRCSTAWSACRAASWRTAAPASPRWTSTRSSRAHPAGRPGRRARPHQRPRLAQRQALAGRRGAARGRHRRHLHRQHPAPGVAQRRRRVDHRRPAARDRAGRGGAPRRPDRAGRHVAAGAAPADGARQHLRAGQGRRGPVATTSGPGNLTALRELALLWVADRVDEDLQQYRGEHGHRATWPAARADRRRPHRRARGRDADPPRRPASPPGAPAARCWPSTSSRSDGLTAASPEELAPAADPGRGPRRHLPLGRRRRHRRRRCWTSPAGSTPPRSCSAAAGAAGWQSLIGPGVGTEVARDSGDIDVHIVTHDDAGRGRVTLPRGVRGSGRARTAAGWVAAVAGPALPSRGCSAPPAPCTRCRSNSCCSSR